MRDYGKIIEYDGYCGTILSVSGIEYLALEKDFNYEEIKEGDIIKFIKEDVVVSKKIRKVARFIDKVK